jgi:hypothetical protein
MKNFSLSLISLSLVVAFFGSANAAETSLNGWGKAYAQAAAQQAQIAANAQADLKVEAARPDDSNFRSSGDQAGRFVAATGTELANAADRLKTTASSTAAGMGEKGKAQGSAMSSKLSDGKPAAPEVTFKGSATAEASGSVGRSVNGSGRATADVVATAGRAAQRAEKPQTTMPEAPKNDIPKQEMPATQAPTTQAPNNEAPTANASQVKSAKPKMAEQTTTEPAPTTNNEPLPESDNASTTPAQQGSSIELSASASASIGVNGLEMPSFNRGVDFDRSALSGLERPVFTRPETISGLLR